MTDTTIGVGDVCLDLAQGRPVHVVEATGQTTDEWSDANDYDLADNYGNSRLGTTADDPVFEVVYCSSAKSEPSKTYAMPAARLLRVETEAADGGRPVYQRVVRDVLETVLMTFHENNMGHRADDFAAFLEQAYDPDLVDEARELVDVEQTITANDD